MMSEERMSSNDVPQKFTEWLLAMGCPAEKIPSTDKMAQICRGQYYMVWRSMMEHVQPKDVIRQKRMQVFCNDIQRCEKANSGDSAVIIPTELSTWREHDEMKTKVRQMEEQVSQARGRLRQLSDKVSSKMAQRNLALHNVESASRRSWLLQVVAEELSEREQNLNETKAIAESLCRKDGHEDDVQDKLDKCVSALCAPVTNNFGSVSMMTGNPIASSSVVSNSDNDECEDHLSLLVKCEAEALWKQLIVRRRALVEEMAKNHASSKEQQYTVASASQSVSVSRAVQCALGLRTLTARAHLRALQAHAAGAVSTLQNLLTNDSCELLVLRCEKVKSEARLRSLMESLEEVTSRSGPFDVFEQNGDGDVNAHAIAQLDRAIVSKREDLNRLLSNLVKTERKIQNVREALTTIFSGFQNVSNDRSQEENQLSAIKQFYEQRRERKAVDISMDMECFDISLSDVTDTAEPTYTDELRVYMKKFNLERNRKLVLDSGEKIWVFETMQSSVQRLHSRWLTDGVTCAMVCPSESLENSLKKIADDVGLLRYLEEFYNDLLVERKLVFHYDIPSLIAEEDEKLDRIKKRMKENMLSLQKTNKTLEVGMKNLNFWSSDVLRKFVSPNRMVGGKSFKEYEILYLDCLNP